MVKLEGSEADGVPIVDLEEATASDVIDALAGSGCMFVTNHGVAPELRRRMIDVSVKFFDLPLEERQRVAWDGTGVWNGWMPNGSGYHRKDAQHPYNLVEWYMAHELDTFDNWPEDPAELPAVWREYYDVVSAIAARVVSQVVAGLGLPAGQLPAWTDRHFASLCLNHYPALLQPPEPGQVRLSPHTDESTITLLTSEDAPGGLQVRMPGRDHWTPVEFLPDTFLVQAGDLLARWTNRLIPASIHRVVNPPDEMAARSQRDTVILFYFPELETVVAPDPRCVAATGGQARFEPISAREHVMRRQEHYIVPEALAPTG